VLSNLIGNAIKFTAPGGSVRVRLDMDSAGALCLSVRDTGIGIHAAELGRVMQPFEQVAPASNECNPGLGLGLPLARHLVELHGGILTLTSEPGVGTLVTVTLPAERLISPA
jgi:signal transduction histidine kinase